MAVIAELRVAGSEFVLGRILGSGDGLDIELETMVPLRQRPVPFVLVHDEVRDAFETRVGRHPAVERITEVERHDGEGLYTLDWDSSRDQLFGAMQAVDATLLDARAIGDVWAFEIRFPSRDALSEFDTRCDDAGIDLTVDRIYNPTDPESGPWFGLTRPQRETLVSAVEGGYYDIPRRMSTSDLAREFDISDQAITERLRRAIVGLTEHTLITTDEQ